MGGRLTASVLLVLASTLPAAAQAPPPTDAATLRHVLSRTTYGARPGDVERVRALGIEAWLEQQLAPERIDDRRVDEALRDLPTLRLSIRELLQQFPRLDPALREKVERGEMSRRELGELYPADKRPARILAELQTAKALRAALSERQLEEVMVEFWFNHFNVFAAKGDVRWYVGPYERDVIRPHALGRFPELVRATARHPAMLFYLDNWASARPGYVIPTGPLKGRRIGLNENYARELMELHTLGVNGGYTQGDVREVARAFTGWSIDRPQVEGGFVYRFRMHDPDEKVVLGQRLQAGGGQDDGERVIDILVRHPATARFIATKLVCRFVADEPPPALVDRVAAIYQRTDGDIRAMLRGIFTAPEFMAPPARRAKIKKPFEFAASAVRALGGSVDTQGGLALAQAAAQIGERLYLSEPPTGYPDRAEPWVNPGALLARMNFGLALAHRRLAGVSIDPASLVVGIDRRQPAAVLDRLVAVILHDEVSEETRRVLASQLRDPQITRLTVDDRGPADTDVETLLALVIGSPEFQRR
jgi:uncharacterized protein (DUF1800 family)